MTLRDFAMLFPEYRHESRTAWRELFARVTPAVRVIYWLLGRGAGKSLGVAVLIIWLATRTTWRGAPGERLYAGIFAPDRKQARVTFRYVVGLLKSVPELAALIERETTESVDLRNSVTIEVITASRAAPRGRSYCAAVVEEASFLPQGDSANPDTELLAALRPALARVPGSVLAVVSSTYARRGITWDAERKYGESAPPDVLYERAPTLAYNPTFDRAAIEKAYETDPAAAAAEYGSEFRSDVESFVSREVVQAATVAGRYELPPEAGITYAGFIDPSGGSADSFCLAIGYQDDEDRVVVAAVRERKPPFAPDGVVAEFAALLASYRVKRIQGDRYAGMWPRSAFDRHGITYDVADRAKSDLYRDALPLLNSGRLELLDLPRLEMQLVGLERRTSRGGRDVIDHAPSAHDDLANVVLGLAATVAAKPPARKRAGILW
jgi:hypothetical protein